MAIMRYTLFCITSIIISFTILLLFLHCLPLDSYSAANKVLLISMDGFRHDYIEKVKANGGKTPNFDYLIKHGSRIMQTKNAFPTITLPNHQTLVTGLYPESHGIVLNTFIDKNLDNSYFDMNNQNNLNEPKWFVNWPEPIWVTLQKRGKMTASHLWPLTDSIVHGEVPFFQESQYTLLDGSTVFPFPKRVDDMVYWLKQTRQNVEFGMLYFPEPDETGHAYGPNSQKIYDKVMELDAVMGRLINQLLVNNMLNKVNIILTSDHGMSEISSEREIPLDKYVDPSWYTSTLLTPVGTLYPKPGKETAVYNGLKKKNPHLEVYWRHEVPAGLNYNIDNGRIAPLILIAENGWSIVHTRTTHKYIGGNHGYNNSVPDVHPFFIAHGPNFRANFTMPTAESVDVYPLMCNLLNVVPNPNNGSLKRIQPILKESEDHYVIKVLLRMKMETRFLLLFVTPALLLVIIIYLMIFHVIARRKTGSPIYKKLKFDEA